MPPPDPLHAAQPVAPPANREELVQRARSLAGRSLEELAHQHCLPIPDLKRAKGWIGQLLEYCLGADAGAEARTDFTALDIELKTLPIDDRGIPRESTYVCTVNLDPTGSGDWRDSWVYNKLKTVLWVPVLGRPGDSARERLIGSALLWEMPEDMEAILQNDWQELMELVSLGRFDRLSARLGTWLQIRPKAMDSKALTTASDANGEPIRTNPRGFYLRTACTREILRRHYLVADN